MAKSQCDIQLQINNIWFTKINRKNTQDHEGNHQLWSTLCSDECTSFDWEPFPLPPFATLSPFPPLIKSTWKKNSPVKRNMAKKAKK